jgi:hypothetical protein
MATIKILAQSKPSAASLTTIYTATTSTVCSSIVITNQSGTPTNFRISVAVNNAADEPKQYIYYDAPIGSFGTFIATIGITLGTNDTLRVYNTFATCSFNLFGQEN